VRRLFWFGAGVAAGVALSRKVNETARKATPSGMAGQLSGAMRELAGAVGSFGADVRVGMNERERELHDVADTSATGRRPRRTEIGAGAADDVGRTPDRRARQAGR
jgi:hypothetical protein